MYNFSFSGKEISFNYVEGDLIANSWKAGTFYEKKLLEKIRSLGLTGTYLDIGAHHGNHSVFFSKFCPSDKVISVEGNLFNFDFLQKNIENNGCNNILINKIVSDQDDQELKMEYSHINTGHSKVVENQDRDTQDHEGQEGLIFNSNSTITLNRLLSDENDITLIKIDVENHEYQVLLGSDEIIKKHHPVIVIELHHNNPYHQEIVAFLEKMGYHTDGINYASSPTFIYFYQE